MMRETADGGGPNRRVSRLFRYGGRRIDLAAYDRPAGIGDSSMEEAFQRGWENLVGRPDGPMSFRFIIQPTVAFFLAIRAGLKDAYSGRSPFLWAVFSNPANRHQLLRESWKDVGTVFIVALILDAIYQLNVHSSIYTLELLLTATLLALVPYALLRGLVTRLARRRPAEAPMKANPEPTKTYGKAPTREKED